MRRQRAVFAADRRQPGVEQREMLGLLGGDPCPVVEELARQALRGETGDDVPAEIDRVQFDMRQGMD
jgi:hypothetical protein